MLVKLVGAVALGWQLEDWKKLPAQMRDTLPVIWRELDLIRADQRRITIPPLGRGLHVIRGGDYRGRGDILLAVRRQSDCLEVHDIVWLPRGTSGYVSLHDEMVKAGVMPPP